MIWRGHSILSVVRADLERTPPTSSYACQRPEMHTTCLEMRARMHESLRREWRSWSQSGERGQEALCQSPGAKSPMAYWRWVQEVMREWHRRQA